MSGSALPRPNRCQTASDTTTIRTSVRTRDRLRAIAAERGLPLGDALDLLVDAYDESRFWDRVDDDFAGLRRDPVGSAAYDDERAVWDAVLGDGLGDR